MLKRRIVLPPEHLYPADEWRIVEARYSDEFVGLTETVFSLGNGFVGVRGSFEEGRPALVPGTFVNGFHETWPITHAEGAHALARTGQTIVNVPDTTIIKLYVDDEPFFLPTARLRDYGRVLDMRAGTLTRELVWATAAGKHVRVRSRRIVSLEHRHLVAMTYEVTTLDEPAPVVVSSLVLNRQDAHQAGDLPEHRPGDPRLATMLPHRVLNVRAAELAGQRILLGYQTTSSGMTLGIGVDHVIETACPFQVTGSLDDHETGEVLLRPTRCPASRSGSPSTPPTSPPAASPCPSLSTGAAGRWTARSATGSTHCSRASARISPGSGTAPTCGCRPGSIRCGSSRRSGGISTRSRRGRGAPKGPVSRRRG